MIAFLADQPRHVDTLARWHHAQWGALYTDWTLADCAAELHDHATRHTRPTTLVAIDDAGGLAGSVSLVDEDAPELAATGDAWLASLYVRPERRGEGLGAALVRALVAHAAALGIPRLWLFTPEHANFYARLGWQRLGPFALNGTPVEVMSLALAPGADG
ncbi:GNAT family N-acetyltransferase [Arenimonas composti]|uniref:N-acetyltransferase domain-containing protein n=1 Tax=Arenimonas composti TR7-09 = DSM 18010 TaxID=1121013 RepID=A0A091C3S8_9GAMM|nr:GNAT family N-acetyltransferase [Arenimonas composti]KFN51310.1 hypothetical protein P873_03315 [Arenimonas composti TR7-09 = DSM 18010]